MRVGLSLVERSRWRGSRNVCATSWCVATAPTTIRSYVQIVDAFRQYTGARLDRMTPVQLRRYHLFLL